MHDDAEYRSIAILQPAQGGFPHAIESRIGTTDYNIMMNSSPPTVDQFNQMPIRITNGVPVLLGDVAHVGDGFAVQNNIVHVDGRRATYLTILKHSEASSLAVVEAARELLPDIRKAAPEGIDISLDFDQSVYVRAAIRNVVTEAVIASLLVSLMILLFLGSWRNTIVVITSIPCAMAAGILGLHPSKDVDDVREKGMYRVLTPDLLLAEMEAAGPFAFVLFHPLLGGIPPESAWRSR